MNDVDWENVIEEVESVGRSELKSVKSLLTRAFEHALKVHDWPDDEAVPHWRREIRNFVTRARRDMDPGMVQHLDILALFANAKDDAEAAELPPSARSLPTGIALDASEVHDVRLGPDDLLARLVTEP